MGQSEWEAVLERVAVLEAHGFTRDRIISLGVMKERATAGKAQQDRLNEMVEAYQQIATLTQLPDMKEIAVQAWANFRETYQAEFTSQHDTENLKRFFEPYELLEIMRDSNHPPIKRVEAGRGGEKISEIPILSTARAGCNVPSGKVTLVENQNPRRRYAWGDLLIPNLANYDDTGIGTTSAVGSFLAGASPYGCEELNGTVWEWSRSAWGGDDVSVPQYKYPYKSKDGREDVNLHNTRVLRGGAFNFAEWCRPLRVLPGRSGLGQRFSGGGGRGVPIYLCSLNPLNSDL